MATTPIDSSKIVENYFTTTSSRNKNTLGKDDFLNLLVTQLQYQDPLKPMEDKEFIGQMAQFSSLEQMQNMNTAFSSVKAFSMIGKEITANVKNAETGQVEEVSGTVESIKMSGGKPYAVVNDQDISIDDIINVYDTPKQDVERITDYTGVIDKNVTAMFIDGESYGTMDMSGDVESLKLIGGSIFAVMNNVDALVKDVEYADNEEELLYKDKSLETYLRDKIQSGEEITAVFTKKDESTGNNIKIKVKAKVTDVQVDDEGKIISTTLDNVRIPAANIHQIR